MSLAQPGVRNSGGLHPPGPSSGTYCWGQSVPTNGTGYDRHGNLLIINVTQCAAPTLNLSVNAYDQITNSGFSYDAAGNMTGDGSYSYAWNGEGLLKSAGTATYTYDGDGKRVEKSSGTYYWFSPSGSVLAETDAGGDTQNEYIYFSGGRTARRDSSGDVYYYFQDQIGSSRLIANSSGTVCYDADFTPFGYEMAYVTSCSQNYKFTGMERDSETGNDHAWFRNYEQNLGRWLSPDPLGGDITNPQSLNRYAYVTNNPASVTDPLGLMPCPPSLITGTGVISAQDQCLGGGGGGSCDPLLDPTCPCDPFDPDCSYPCIPEIDPTWGNGVRGKWCQEPFYYRGKSGSIRVWAERGELMLVV